MSDIQEKLAAFEKRLATKQKELLKKQNEIHGFVDTKHKAKATKQYQQEMRKLAIEINDFVILLIETKENAGEQKELADKLCTAGLGLNGLTKDLGQALANDLAERRHDETFDVVKIAGVVGGLAAAAVTVSRYSFDPSSSHVVAEASAGAALGLGAATWNPLCKGFVYAWKHLCDAPQKIKHSFALHYMTETFREIGQDMSRPFRNETSFMIDFSNDDETSAHRAGTNKRTRKFSGPNL